MNKKNIMYLSYQMYMVYTALEMQKINWDPVFWSTNKNIEQLIDNKFPQSINHDHYLLAKGIIPNEIKKSIIKINIEEILRKLLSYKENIMRMIMRNDSLTDSMTEKEKENHYHILVKYWLYIINKTKPDFAIFEEEPHQASEYILYSILKILDIKTIMFINTKFYKTMYPLMNFEEGSRIIKSKYIKNIESKNLKLSDENLIYLKKIRGTFDQAMDYHLYSQINEVQSILNKKETLISDIISLLKFILKKLFDPYLIKRLYFLFTSNFDSDQKQYGRLLEKSNLTYIEYLYYKLKTILKKRYLKNYYKKITSKDLSINRPYLYCTLQYQPEKTTCPLGNSFDDQLKMVTLLSKACPDDWKIYVREHPSQFISAHARYGERYRSVNYYNTIKNLPNIELVPLEYDNFKLIDNAKATISVTSTSGWESLVRGKPSINFGYSWYRFCKGNFYAKDYDSLKEIIELIQRGYKVKQHNIESFVYTIQTNSIRTYSVNFLRGDDKISDKKIGLSHVEAINQILTSSEYLNDI